MTPKTSATPVLVLCLLGGARVLAQGNARASSIHVTDYAISIDLPDSGSSINGDATLTVRQTGRNDTLALDLRKLNVQRVTIDGRDVKFSRTDSTIAIPIASETPSTFKARVVYEGAVTDGLIAHRDSAGRWTWFGDNWPNRARFWIPSIDEPSEKATVSWTVTAPAGHVVVANGALVEDRSLPMAQRGRVLSRWRESKPLPPYLMVIAAAPMVKYDLGQTACGLADVARCVPQSVYAAPEQRNKLPGAFAHAGDIVAYYASLVGFFPYEKLAHLQSETRYGGMENATAIFYADQLFRRDSGVPEGIIAHETAHQWFGDAVTERSWPHVWLSEGFATYFAALWTRRAHGDSAFRAEMEGLRSTIIADTAYVAKRPVIDTIEPVLINLLNHNSYDKGAWVLHMLRSELGDSAFFDGLRHYFADHKHGTALTDDLRASLERASHRDLRALFDQWLRRPGYPDVRLTWTSDATLGTVVTVTQGGRFGYFAFTLPVVVVDSRGVQHLSKLSIGATERTIAQAAPPGDKAQRVIFDPDVTVLMSSAHP